MTAASSDREQILKYQAEGYADYLEGKHPIDIPYRHGHPGAIPWAHGYNQARTDRAIENRKVTR